MIERFQVFGYSARCGGQIKTGNRAAGGDEQRQVDEQHLEPALIEAHDHRGQQQRRENNQ